MLVGVLTFCVYIPSLSSGFVDWDDNVNFLQNPAYRGLGLANLDWMFSSFHLGHYHPLTWVTLGLDYVVWGMNPLGYHLTSAILHALSAIVLSSLSAAFFEECRGGREAVSSAPRHVPDGAGGPALWFGVFVSLAWSLHPLRVEAVSWITERREVLCGLLTLLAVRSHVANRPKWLIAVLTIGAMLAKATAITVPPLLILVDVYRAGRNGAPILAPLRRSIASHALLLGAAVIVGLTAMIAQREAAAMVSYERLPLSGRLVLTLEGAAFCAIKSFWPEGLAPLHQGTIGSTWGFHQFIWWEAGAALVLSAAIFAMGWRRRREGLGMLCLLGAYLVMIVPAGGLGQSGPQTAADRYTYQPAWALTLAVGLILSFWTRWPCATRGSWKCWVPTWAILGVLALLSVRQQQCWHDSLSLWRRQLDVYPDSPTGNYQIGRYYVGAGDFENAERSFKAAITWAPGYDEPQTALGMLYRTTGRLDEAIKAFAALLQVRPLDHEALFQLGTLLWDVGRTDESVEVLGRLSNVDPRNVGVSRLLGKAQAAAHRPRDAIATFERSIALTPHPVLFADLAWLLATHPDSAVRDGRRAVELISKAPVNGAEPDPHATVLIAAVYAEAGDFERAIREVRASIPKLPPASEPAMRHLIEDLERREPVRAEPRFP